MGDQQYIPALTGMRGAASVYVMLYHLITLGLISSVPIIVFGWSGVDFFFVLSGYLLASLYSSVNTRYFVRRIFRTFPLYYATIPLYVITGMVIFTPWWLVYAQIYTFFSWTNPGPQWTLCLEELFYFLILPFLFKIRLWCGHRWVLMFSCATIVAGVVSVIYGEWIATTITTTITTNASYYSIQMPFYFVDYMIGFTFSGIVLSERIRKWVLLLSAAFFGLIALNFGGHIFDPLAPSGSAITYGLIVLSLGNSWLFANRAMELIGKWSYSIYILHLPLMIVFGFWGVPLTLVLSAASYYLFEKQFMKLGNRIIGYFTDYSSIPL